MHEIHDTMTTSPTRAFLVGVKLKDELQSDAESSLEELRRLAETAGMEVLAEIIQPKETPDPAYFIGRGKLEELEAIAGELKVEAVIFDNDLTPAQTRNLEKALDAIVVDRTSLILQIFAQRAQTRSAKLQVDLSPTAIRVTAFDANVDAPLSTWYGCRWHSRGGRWTRWWSGTWPR